jgi:hypothetical protein
VSKLIFMRLSSLARKNEQDLRDRICNYFVNSVSWSRETFSSEDVSLLLLSSLVYSFLSCHHKFYIPYCCNGLSPRSYDQAAGLVASFPSVPQLASAVVTHLASAARGPRTNINNKIWRPPSLFPFILTVNSIWTK